MSDEERVRQAVLSETLFREVNERIDELQRGFGSGSATIQVVCECGNPACTDQIDVGVPLYERVRSDGTLFIVRPGHEDPSVEDVVEPAEEWNVVRKHPGLPADVAEATDPRGV
ncbi:MAG: hypothetical protein JOZ56_02395 [Actinobacteria bacterium]|nr:hypothetical protein [Actinomycetota bacterium]